jgi:hypothetical protein
VSIVVRDVVREDAGMVVSMAQYLAEIEFAVTTVLQAVWKDHLEVHRLHDQVKQLEAAATIGYQRAESLSLSAEDPEDIAAATGLQWDTYFGEDKERHDSQAELDEVKARFAIRKFSSESMAGAVLQFAKQGISLVHSGLTNSPSGRSVHSLNLAEVIWQARNQAIHWEERNLSSKVTDCFTELAKDFNDPRLIDEIYDGSQAFRIVHLLQWRDWQSFHKDLLTLS